MTIEGVRAEVIHARAKHLTDVHGVDDVVGVAAGVDER